MDRNIEGQISRIRIRIRRLEEIRRRYKNEFSKVEDPDEKEFLEDRINETSGEIQGAREEIRIIKDLVGGVRVKKWSPYEVGSYG